MASHQDAQKLFRQQISIARQLLSLVDRAESRPAELAATQGCLLALEMGLLAYCRAIFDAPDIAKLRDCQAYAGNTDYRQREILNLLEVSDSWLIELGKIFASLKQMPKPREQAQSADLIVSSAAVREIHWTLLDKELLGGFLDEIDVLQKRHADSDEEY